ncbi:cytochrome b5-like Heme/Steroid binding domain-containing protein [Colletotrichum musicola]|uniref:Cytochrome b5-like Heme/Steroid binding domain-containing protein n=1 Tax=Colletotrichum musicola TaxID=2175873 RepID=A0A8H6N8X0_9PEZI|nr:cytochrome b5-like Heme/Steroid binding domain-containing protein [Colletotrichum musicola]
MAANPPPSPWRTFRDEPDTPWSREYAAGKTQPPLHSGKSWLDPSFPPLDPVTLHPADEDVPPQPLPRPSPRDLDDLFRSERVQSEFLFGLRAWEAAVLAKVRDYAAGTKEEAHITGEEVEVDESRWLKIWRRGRWAIEFTQRGHFSGEREVRWSMEDDAVWGEFRRAVQVADDILRNLMHGTWLPTLMAKAGGIELAEVEIPHGSGQKRRIWRMKQNPTNLPSAARIRELFESEHFYRGVVWSFHDVSQQFDPEGGWDNLALTWSAIKNNRARSIISLDVRMLKPLVDPRSRGDVKRAAVYGVAVTHYLNYYLHTDTELVNAIGKPTPSDTPMTECPKYDIFGPGEKWCELGFSMEEATFGGDLWGLETQGTGAHFRTSNLRSLIYSTKNQPHMSQANWAENTYDIPWTEPNHMTSYPVPASWVWSLSARDFWDKVVAKYGPAALRRPGMLRRKMLIIEPTYPVQVTRTAPAEWVADFQPREWERETLRNLARQLTARRLLWDRIRKPWFEDAFAMWQQTPYAWIWMLRYVYRAQEVLFARRGMHDQRDADGIVRLLCTPYAATLNTLPGSQRGDVMFVSMTGVEYDPHDELAPVAWFFRAVGLLVQAALPFAPRPVEVPERKPRGGHGNPRGFRRDAYMAMSEDEAEEAAVSIIAAVRSRWTYPAFTVHARHCFYGEHQGADDTFRIRMALVHLAGWAFDKYAGMCRVPAGVFGQFFRAADALRNAICADGANGFASWHPLPSVLPPYAGRWEPMEGMAEVTGLLEFRATASQGWSADGGTLRTGTDVEDKFWGEEPDARTDLPTWAQMAGPRTTLVPAGRRLRRHEVDYFTIAELYDRARRLGDMFVLLEDGHDLNLYNRAVVNPAVGLATDEEIAAATTRTYYGLQLTAEAADKFLKAFPDEPPFGRMTKILRAEDVVTGDGESGRPLWIQIQREVFDITHLRCASDADLQAALESRPGGDPSAGILNEGYSLENVTRSLAMWRVGILAPDAGTPPENRHAVRVFTGGALRRHEFKQTGMYMAIDGVVYDITEYADFHPGGMACFSANAGRDATDAFRKNHANHEDILQKMQGHVVGRLVATRPRTARGGAPVVQRDEVQIRDDIYSISELKSSGENDALADALAQYLGTDATPEMQAQPDDGPLMQLFPLKGFIVAVAENTDDEEQLGQMTPDELQLFNGDINEGEGWRNGAYVAVDDKVYDVTDPITYGLSNDANIRLIRYLGRIVQDPGLAQYVRKQCRHLICAQLVSRRVITPGAGGAFMWHSQRPLPVPLQMTPLDHEEPTPPSPPCDDDVAPLPSFPDRDSIKRTLQARFLSEHIFAPVPSRTGLENMVTDLASRFAGERDDGYAGDVDSSDGARQQDLGRRLADLNRREARMAEDEYADLFNRYAGNLQIPEGMQLQQPGCQRRAAASEASNVGHPVVPVTRRAKKRGIRFVGDGGSGSSGKRRKNESEGYSSGRSGG